MASLVPRVDFGFIGQLPDVYNEARTRQLSKESLADLQSAKTPEDFRRIAGKLATVNPELATHYLTLANQQITAEAARTSAAQRGADIELWRQLFSGGKIPQYGGGAAAEPFVGAVPGVGSGPGPAPAPAPALPGIPGMPGVRGVGPGASLPPSPTEAVLAQAEGPAPAPLPPTQLAGPLPTPDTGPPQMASTAPVPFAPQGPIATPVPPVPQAPAPGPMPMQTPTQEAARGTELRIGNATVALPPRAQSWPLFRANMTALQNSLAQQKATPKQSEYALDQAQNSWLGKPVQSMGDWEAEKQSRPETFKDALKNYGEVRTAGKSANETINILDRMDQIASDKNFISGAGTGYYKTFIGGLNSLARSINVDLQNYPEFQNAMKVLASPVDNHAKSVALMEAYDSLAGRAVFEMAGGNFSRGFSEGDRVYMANILGSSGNTPQGLKAIRGQIRAVAEHNQGLAKAANDYMTENQKGATATPWGLDTALEKYRNDHPLFAYSDGRLTERGKKLNADLGIPGPAAPTAKPSGRTSGGLPWSQE